MTIPTPVLSKPVRERKVFGMSNRTPKLETIDLELADVDDNILAEVTEDMARKEAEKKESNVLKFVDERGYKKLFFKRWLFIWCDMKGL